MRTMFRWLGVPAVSAVLLLAAGCGKKDNSADTDKASEELRKAQAEVKEGSTAVAKNQHDIEARKRELLREQQALADKEKLLAEQQLQLVTAEGSLKDARAAYASAVKLRFSKLDTSLATLATRTDAKAKDAATGLRARRDQLSLKLDAMAGTPDPSWNAYTKDVDTTFDAIEGDLLKALE